MTVRNFLKYYICFIMFSIVIGILIGLLPTSDVVAIAKPELGWRFTLEILKNNSNNFLSYLFLFFLSPILQFIDLISVLVQITLGVRKVGFITTIQGLLPHGLLEIPNLLFYQGLSQYVFLNLWFEKDITKFILREKKYIKYYLISYSVLFVAAVIEGFMG